MSKKENDRVRVLVSAGESGRTNGEVALALGLCARQVQRLKKVLREEGPAGLAHGNRGSIPKHALRPETVASVVDLYETKYQGFNFSHPDCRDWWKSKGYRSKGPQSEECCSLQDIEAQRIRLRRTKHRSRRQRRACEGAMVQIDGSPHDWLEGRGPLLCLVGGIDDATGKVPGAVFREHEDAHGYFLMMRQIVMKHGIPETVYRDRHGIFERNPKEPTDIWEDPESIRDALPRSSDA